MRSEKEVSIVTGASRGIGRAIAVSLAKQNHNVIVFGRDVNALEEVCSELKQLGSDSIYFSGDVADQQFVFSSFEKILLKYERVDHLINNAGIGIFKKFIDSSLEEFKNQVDVNLFGVYNFTKAVAGEMIKNKKGTIINIASLAGKNSFIGGTMYSSTKHALLGFTRSLMLELREFNIKVASICPGSVDTEFSSSGRLVPHKKNILLPEDVAEAVMLIINSPQRAMFSEIDIRPTNP
ncbi:MAG: SDR family NAD(P)-dependent oxidoreductase [Ignavibacteriales bacterium]|nr:MAG: SDR family NAD(P)-dependent oxidoreductase [Ignavibacteriales bacterium]